MRLFNQVLRKLVKRVSSQNVNFLHVFITKSKHSVHTGCFFCWELTVSIDGGVATLVAYSPGCDGRSPSLKTLIRYKNYLQDLSILFLQGAFFVENWRSAILHSRRNEVTYGYVCDGESLAGGVEQSDLRIWLRAVKP